MEGTVALLVSAGDDPCPPTELKGKLLDRTPASVLVATGPVLSLGPIADVHRNQKQKASTVPKIAARTEAFIDMLPLAWATPVEGDSGASAGAVSDGATIGGTNADAVASG